MALRGFRLYLNASPWSVNNQHGPSVDSLYAPHVAVREHPSGKQSQRVSPHDDYPRMQTPGFTAGAEDRVSVNVHILRRHALRSAFYPCALKRYGEARGLDADCYRA